MKKGDRKERKKLLSEKKNKNTEREKTRTTQSQCMQQKKGEHRNRKITRENVFFGLLFIMQQVNLYGQLLECALYQQKNHFSYLDHFIFHHPHLTLSIHLKHFE